LAFPGEIPGLEIGQRFHCRAELKCCGGHLKDMAGIDYRPGKSNICSSICVSGGYEDDDEFNCDEFWYTGQGGNDFLGTNQQMEDQQLKTGNLALANSIQPRTEIRVFVKTSEDSMHQSLGICTGKKGKQFVYTGLYNCVSKKCVPSKGTKGVNVWKFRMRRIAGQDALRLGPSVKLCSFNGSKRKITPQDDLRFGLQTKRLRALPPPSEEEEETRRTVPRAKRCCRRRIRESDDEDDADDTVTEEDESSEEEVEVVEAVKQEEEEEEEEERKGRKRLPASTPLPPKEESRVTLTKLAQAACEGSPPHLTQMTGRRFCLKWEEGWFYAQSGRLVEGLAGVQFEMKWENGDPFSLERLQEWNFVIFSHDGTTRSEIVHGENADEDEVMPPLPEEAPATASIKQKANSRKPSEERERERERLLRDKARSKLAKMAGGKGKLQRKAVVVASTIRPSVVVSDTVGGPPVPPQEAGIEPPAMVIAGIPAAIQAKARPAGGVKEGGNAAAAAPPAAAPPAEVPSARAVSPVPSPAASRSSKPAQAGSEEDSNGVTEAVKQSAAAKVKALEPEEEPGTGRPATRMLPATTPPRHENRPSLGPSGEIKINTGVFSQCTICRNNAADHTHSGPGGCGFCICLPCIETISTGGTTDRRCPNCQRQVPSRLTKDGPWSKFNPGTVVHGSDEGDRVKDRLARLEATLTMMEPACASLPRLTAVENEVYGDTQAGAMLDRLTAVEKTMYG